MAEKKSGPSNSKNTSTRKPRSSSGGPVVSLQDLKREIDERAHAIYLERVANHTAGDALSDWLQAEAEVKKKHKLA